jgi:Domain of unknown function (DUF4129)
VSRRYFSAFVAFMAFIACALLNGIATAAAPQAAAEVQVLSQLPDIESCVRRLDPELDIGYDRIAARCPELMKQLDQGAWAPWLPRGWKEPGNDLSAGGLREFRALVDREDAAGASPRAPDVRRLKSVLNGLADRKADGWWSRFKAWLRSILEAPEQPADEGWFARMVSHAGLSQSIRQVIAYAALSAVVVLAALIVFNELRTADLLRQRQHAASGRRARAETVTSQNAWSDIERAPLLDRPRLLLEVIVRRLGERGYLPPAKALTAREMSRVARLPEPDDRTRLAEVATAAERVRYSAHEPEGAALDRSIVRGRELLDRLDASASR